MKVIPPPPPLAPDMGLSKLLTPDEVSRRLGVTTRTVRRYIRAGVLPAVRLSPRVLRVWESDLEAMLAACADEQR